MSAEPSRARDVVAALAAVTLAASACTVAAEGNPVPSAMSSTVTTASGEPEDDVPRVEDPLDPTPFLADPCSVLTADQANEFSAREPGKPTTTGATAEHVGPYCIWFTTSGGDFSTGIIVGNKHGLRDVYRGRDQFEDFRPTSVDGYPAVFANAADLRDKGLCTILAAVNDTALLRVTEGGHLDAEAACARAGQLTAAALRTMRAGS